MNEFSSNVLRYTKYTLYLLAVFVVGWGFTDYQVLFQGLISGTLLSFFNLWHLYRQTKTLGQAAVDGTRAFSLGIVPRIAVAVLAGVAIIRFPETFHMLGVIIGLMSTYIIILIDSLFQTKNLSQGKR
jgi:ATP synthase protein I